MRRTQRQGPAYAGRSEPGASGQSWRSSSLRGSSWLSSLLSTPNGNGGERGGAIKDGNLEIQGAHRDVVEAELVKQGYRVKRTGG